VLSQEEELTCRGIADSAVHMGCADRDGKTGCVAGVNTIVLAGGLGTRIRPALPGLPKVLAPVAGRPFLEYLLIHLQRQGFHDVTLAVGHMADHVEAQFGTGKRLGLHLHYSREHESLGTGGALRLALAVTDSNDLLVLNGDSYFGIDLAALLSFHRERRAAATLALARVSDSARYGSVSIGPTREVLAFHEKGEVGGGVINAGIYVFRRSVVDAIMPRRVVSLERDAFPRLVGRGLYGIILDGHFVDIGTLEAYKELCRHPSGLVASVLGGHL